MDAPLGDYYSPNGDTQLPRRAAFLTKICFSKAIPSFEFEKSEFIFNQLYFISPN
jgi:hypothetical protein